MIDVWVIDMVSQWSHRTGVKLAISIGSVAFLVLLNAYSKIFISTAHQQQLIAGVGPGLTVCPAAPPEPFKGGAAMIHMIYGLTTHMGDVDAIRAQAGCTDEAPAFFDQLKFNAEAPFTREGVRAWRAAPEMLFHVHVNVYGDHLCATCRGPLNRLFG